MNVFVLVVGIVQALIGLILLARWIRAGRRAPGVVVAHVAANLAALVLWATFVLTGTLWVAWTAFVLLTVGNGFGDAMLLSRARRLHGASDRFWKGYGDAVAAVFRGRMPPHVAFHALFSGVVYFGMLIACILASVV